MKQQKKKIWKLLLLILFAGMTMSLSGCRIHVEDMISFIAKAPYSQNSSETDSPRSVLVRSIGRMFGIGQIYGKENGPEGNVLENPDAGENGPFEKLFRALFGGLLKNTAVPETVAETVPETEAQPVPAAPDVYTIALIGSDRRDASWFGNADTMMLLSVNRTKQTVSLISLMRDIGANIPGRGYDKMNAALAAGGPDLVVQTIASNFQITVNGYIFVDFGGMINIIDQFGGVTLEVSADEANVMNTYIEEFGRIFGINPGDYWMTQGGVFNLNGVRAVAYMRNRYSGTGGDFDRTARQRRVLSVLYGKMQAMSLAELQQRAAAILPVVQTNISWDGLVSLIPAVIQSGYTVIMDRVPYDGLYGYGAENFDLAWPETIARLRATLY